MLLGMQLILVMMIIIMLRLDAMIIVLRMIVIFDSSACSGLCTVLCISNNLLLLLQMLLVLLMLYLLLLGHGYSYNFICLTSIRWIWMMCRSIRPVSFHLVGASYTSRVPSFICLVTVKYIEQARALSI